MKLSDIRNEYLYAELSKKNIDPNPILQFEKWLANAIKAEVKHPTAMSLITTPLDTFPQSRIVLLKNFDDKGFTFFTSYNSEKAKSISKNHAVGIHFFWPEMERQVRISGFAKKTSAEISDEYFNSRPLLSQIAAVVSKQSENISSRKYMVNLFETYKKELGNSLPLRPKDWGGYIVKPVKIEFWQGRANRLHDRILYTKQNKDWKISRLAP